MRIYQPFIPMVMMGLLCTLLFVPMELFGQRHAGHKGRYFSIGINNLVNTFPASPPNIAKPLSQGFPVGPEVNPALEVEVAAFRKVGVGVHAARRSLGVRYRHDVIWYYQPDPDSERIPETVHAGVFPYKWNRIGIDLFFYRHGYQAPLREVYQAFTHQKLPDHQITTTSHGTFST